MKTKTKIRKTNKAVQSFIKSLTKNYNVLMKKLKVIWACVLLCITVAVITQSCNVTRKVTTEASYFQKGDTTTTIITKTVETYDASKNK